jgi:hypothetical protein
MDEEHFDHLKALVADCRARGRARVRPVTQVVPASSAPDDLPFADRVERLAGMQADHWARRRRADAEVSSQDRIFSRLRDRYGIDEAERIMR